MRSKKNSIRLYGSLKMSKIQQKLLAKETIEGVGCPFFRRYWLRNNSGVIKMQNCQFSMVHGLFFSRSHWKSSKKAEKEANHSSSWQCNFSNISWNKEIFAGQNIELLDHLPNTSNLASNGFLYSRILKFNFVVNNFHQIQNRLTH